jgi:hypothetical protein
MITDSFDPRTLANMEVALERACKILGVDSELHQARSQIADKIVECAKRGDRTLGGLTHAGRVAASDLRIARATQFAKLHWSSHISRAPSIAFGRITLH